MTEKATVIVVPREFEDVLPGPPWQHEPFLYGAAVRLARTLARDGPVLWFTPVEYRRFPEVHYWRTRMHQCGALTLCQPLRKDLYEQVGEALYNARLDMPVVLWSHSGLLVEDIAVAHRDMHAVHLVGIPAGVHRVSRLGGDSEEVRRHSPGHFRKPPPTVARVHWFTPPHSLT